MSSEILINITPSETRAAVVENGVLQEVFIERSEYRGLVGNIYKGKVCRVLPGMQAAFVDIGLPRAAFLHVSDISIPKGQTGDLKEAPNIEPTISSLLREGQEILVQVIKDPMGTKGARLTTQLSVSSRYLVYMPETEGIGVSLKIETEEERERLKNCLTSLLEPGTGGAILRTAAEGVSEAELEADLKFFIDCGANWKNASRPSTVASRCMKTSRWRCGPCVICSMPISSGSGLTRQVFSIKRCILPKVLCPNALQDWNIMMVIYPV